MNKVYAKLVAEGIYILNEKDRTSKTQKLVPIAFRDSVKALLIKN